MTDSPTAVLPQVRPPLVSPAPTITAVIMLAASNLAADSWAHYIRNVRTSLDIAQARRYETHACGAEGERRTVWYAEIHGDKVPELRSDLEYYAGYLRANDSAGRLVWAPCSPIDLA